MKKLKRNLITTAFIAFATAGIAGNTAEAAETYYVKATANTCSQPKATAKKKTKVYQLNKVTSYQKIGNWHKISVNGTYAYVSGDKLTKKTPKSVKKATPKKDNFKSYMSYKAITKKSSPQYKLQKKAYTGKYGIRMVDDRYCIAVGSYYTKKIGTKVDVVLKNGTTIKCIVGDQKANGDTDAKHMKTADGSVVEFLITPSKLNKSARRMGDMSYCSKAWKGNINYIKVYK